MSPNKGHYADVHKEWGGSIGTDQNDHQAMLLSKKSKLQNNIYKMLSFV